MTSKLISLQWNSMSLYPAGYFTRQIHRWTQQYRASDAGAETELLMAASVVALLPVLILYFFAQRQFTEGIATTGLKG